MILSMVLPRQDVRDIGRYEDGSSVLLSGLRSGMTIDFFHSAGT